MQDEQEEELMETDTEFESDNENSSEEDSESDKYQCIEEGVPKGTNLVPPVSRYIGQPFMWL